MLVTVASIPWYLTLNSQVLLSQVVLHVAYANGIEGRERPLSQMQTQINAHKFQKRQSRVMIRD